MTLNIVNILFILTYLSHFNIMKNWDYIKLNGTHQLVAYADDVNIAGKTLIPYRKTQKLY
jgi:hypothetical protein